MLKIPTLPPLVVEQIGRKVIVLSQRIQPTALNLFSAFLAQTRRHLITGPWQYSMTPRVRNPSLYSITHVRHRG